MLELKNIKKSFGGTEVLKNVGLSEIGRAHV